VVVQDIVAGHDAIARLHLLQAQHLAPELDQQVVAGVLKEHGDAPLRDIEATLPRHQPAI
jgi:hypothetical protein